MLFTDLDFDCLEYVLEYLELPDLLNLADSTKRLRKAAELVYARKYGKKWLQFREVTNVPDQPFQLTDKAIDCQGLKMSLQLLRCFGPAISTIKLGKIETEHPNPSQMDHRIFTYINEYCAEYLSEFLLPNQHDSPRYYRRPALDYIDKPFTNLIRLSHGDYNFTEEICLKTLFPKLQKLSIALRSNASFFKLNTKHFPSLEIFHIIEDVRDNPSILQNDMVVPFLQMNPQLKELALRSNNFRSSNLNMNLIWIAADNLQDIETLELRIKPITFKIDISNFIRIRSVKKFEINFCHMVELPVCFFPFSFEQLEKFIVDFPKKKISIFFYRTVF